MNTYRTRDSRGGRPSHFGHRARPQHGQRRYNRPTTNIDVSRLINKAAAIETESTFVPEYSFSDLPISDHLKKNITQKGYTVPTPIQDKTIPHIMKGADVVGIANTGTGKTAAFLIPLIERVLSDKKQRVLIVVPTRELAQQIEQEYWGFADYMRIGAVTVVGGANINPQIALLRRKPNFVIGTPGRLKDVIERGVLDLAAFQTVVLDEADRMLDMGFIHDMKYLMSLMPAKRQTLFFSATLSREIEALIGQFLSNPVRISVKTGDTAKTVDQDVIRVGNGSKFDMLLDLLRQPEFSKVIVFGRTKYGIEKLAKQLVESGIKAESIHGNKTQNKRQKALDLFKRDHVQVLCATDVAARGIDVSGVSHVINFDLPATYEDYVHRIGRTGRAGKGGKALSFV